MAAGRLSPTFLIWTPTQKAEDARKEDLFRRHQHAARVNHQMRKDHSKTAKQVSKDERPQPRALFPKTVTQQTKGANLSACMFPSAWLERPLSPACIDPFDVFCVKGLPGHAQHALKFCEYPPSGLEKVGLILSDDSPMAYLCKFV
jgi:hypothetical protein